MRYSIYKGDRPSDGARALADALGATVLRASGSAFAGGANRTLINWGMRNEEINRLWRLAQPHLRLNNPSSVARASNKLTALQTMRQGNVSVVPYWTGESIADAYNFANNGGRVYARTELTGHSGAGIRLILPRSDQQRDERTGNIPRWWVDSERQSTGLGQFRVDFGNCQLFTQGISGHRHEWRAHVFRGQVILLQLKMRREGFQDNDGYTSLVRNQDTGWVYSVNFDRSDLTGIDLVEAQAIAAIEALGLDFGAVDIIQKKRETDQVFVLEVNTAPGLAEGGSSLSSYADAIRAWGEQQGVARA